MNDNLGSISAYAGTTIQILINCGYGPYTPLQTLTFTSDGQCIDMTAATLSSGPSWVQYVTVPSMNSNFYSKTGCAGSTLTHPVGTDMNLCNYAYSDGTGMNDNLRSIKSFAGVTLQILLNCGYEPFSALQTMTFTANGQCIDVNAATITAGPSWVQYLAVPSLSMSTTPSLSPTPSPSPSPTSVPCGLVSITYTSVTMASNPGSGNSMKNAVLSGTQGAGTCTVKNAPLDAVHNNQGLCAGGTASYFGQHFHITFCEPVGAVWILNYHIDDGFGFYVTLDNGGIFTFSGNSYDDYTLNLGTISAGCHSLDVYGGEDCCDGNRGGWSFQRGSGPVLMMNQNNLLSVCKNTNLFTATSTVCSSANAAYTSVALNSNPGAGVAMKTAVLSGSQVAGTCTNNNPSLSTTHANHDLCPSGISGHFGQHFAIRFCEPSGIAYSLVYHIDSGYGLYVTLDNVGIYTNPNNVYDDFTLALGVVGAGCHVIDVYGGEDCCDGNRGGWSLQRGSDYIPINTASLVAQCQLFVAYTPSATTCTSTFKYTSVTMNNNPGSGASMMNAVLYGSHGSGTCTNNNPAFSLHHSNQALCSGGTNNHFGQHFSISFCEPRGSLWTLFYHIDSGYGLYITLDGVGIVTFAGNAYDDYTLNLGYVLAGCHQLDIYGGEDCCDGDRAGWNFQRGSGATLPLTTSNLINQCLTN